jgi:hypothetical protein
MTFQAQALLLLLPPVGVVSMLLARVHCWGSAGCH